jgi:hypothetical protein
MPEEELRVDLAQEGSSFHSRPSFAGGFPDPLSGYGMDWWLAQAAGVGRRRRGVGRRRGTGPVIGTGEVALRRGLGIEDDVGHLAGLPLMLEKLGAILSISTSLKVVAIACTAVYMAFLHYVKYKFDLLE